VYRAVAGFRKTPPVWYACQGGFVAAGSGLYRSGTKLALLLQPFLRGALSRARWRAWRNVSIPPHLITATLMQRDLLFSFTTFPMAPSGVTATKARLSSVAALGRDVWTSCHRAGRFYRDFCSRYYSSTQPLL